MAGTWTIEVSADTIGADGHRETAATDVDYALVVTGRASVPGKFTNDTDFPVNDLTTIESPITVSGIPGNAPATLQVEVNITHTFIGDLVVTLVAPDGSLYVLHNRTGGGTDNINTTYTVDASSEVANGTWLLRVSDQAAADFGTLNLWSLAF